MAFSLVSSANYNQAAECLPTTARGRQCVTSCLMFLFTASEVNSCENIDSSSLNEILFAGSYLYCALYQSNLVSGLVDPALLSERISYKGKTLNIQHAAVFSGFILENVLIDGVNFHSLEDAVLKAYSVLKNFILVFSGLSVGIRFENSVFYIFDSHSRDENGMCCPDGKCVLGVVKSTGELCSYLRSLAQTVSQLEDCVQFDLHAFRFYKSFRSTSYHIEILDTEQCFKIRKCSKRKKKGDNEPDSMKKQKNMTETQTTSVRDLLEGRNSCNGVCLEQLHVPDVTQQLTGNEQLASEIPCDAHLEKVAETFEKIVSVGPDYVCSCCTQTFFRHCMRDVEKLSNTVITEVSKYLTNYKSVGNAEWVCRSCLDALRQRKIPKFWVNNGLKFPMKPKELELSNLEERLVSPRLPFMQLREMPRGGQINLKGNIVNVPADVNSTIKSLPRMINENETIMLKLKRKLCYKHHVAFENIRPNKVFEAAKWLVGNSTLFKNEGIVVNETWLQHPNEVIDEQAFQENSVSAFTEANDESSDHWTEGDSFLNRPTGNLDTCLQSVDFREFNRVLSVAPGERSSPIGLFQDIHSEVLSFPTLFCGQSRVENEKRLVSLHYSDICKWELRNVDRRVALSVPNIFFKLKRLQIKQIKDKVSLAIRKCKTKGKKFTVSEILAPGFVDKMTMQNDGYRVLRTLRGSPPYWEAAKRDMFAMIRQLGIPTWFCSFSAAETKWEALLKSLAKLVQGKDLSAEEINSLSWQDKCSLIKSDPVTCARYFDHRVQTFIRHILKHHSEPIGIVQDYFYRVEFQQRGSPHIHMIIWIRDAPVHGVASDATVSRFVEKYITCRKDETMPTFINYQTHRHAQTCRKHGKTICRFNFPIPPMPETVVLHPLDDAEKMNDHTKDFEKVISALNELHKTEKELLFEDFLAHLDMTYDTYIKVIRSTLTRAKVFLRRSVAECRINNYNPVLLKSWQANMDMQYILDPYSCVSYIVSYISKGQRGLSNLLQEACREAQEADSDVRQQVRRIGNQFLSSVEIGAQEAVYLVLQMPLRRCTRDIIYVDTKKSSDRTALIKPMSDLKELPAGSVNVEMDNLLKRYKRRPKHMEAMCYADFASWYELCKNSKKVTKVEETSQASRQELPETEYEINKEDDFDESDEDACTGGSIVEFACGTRIRKRRSQKIIYSHVTPINQDKEEHFREKIMLYTHWRNDEKDLLGEYGSFEQSFEAKLEEMNVNQVHYEQHDDGFYENVLQDVREEFGSDINPETQHQELIDVDEGPSVSASLGCFDPGNGVDETDSYDLGEDLGVSRRPVGNGILPQKELDNEQFLEGVRILNTEQKRFFYHVLKTVKTQSLPFYTFLSGGAGCGKSVIVRAVSQALLKYFNHRHSEDPSTMKLLLCAPTGKAAHNIGGSTLHSAFCIPANQGFHFKPLDMQQLNTMRSRYHDLKIVIIDEISMVGREMLNFVNLRLKEIKGCTEPFGNVSILAVGDLYQLKPVHDAWVFSQVFKAGQLQCMGTNIWIDLFDFFELHKVMRQKDDMDFALLLNRLREGIHTDEDLAILERRRVQNLQIPTEEIKQIPHLFCRRADTYAHNEAILSDMPSTDIINIEAIDTVSGNVGRQLHDKILSRVPLDPSQTMGLHKTLVLGLGMPAELCSNIDTADGLTNGASCSIRKYDFRVQDSSRCSIVWVEFDDSLVGQNWRIKYKHLYRQGIPRTWTPVLEVCRRFTYRFYKTYLIVRRQFPIYLSAGKTIHKAQGSTIKKGVMHFGSRKIDHIHYVGLSRVTSLSGVHILELNSAKISVSLSVQAEMERLRVHRNIKECLPDLSSSGTGELKICFHNCRSLRKHIKDIKEEHNLLCADIIGLVETGLSGPLTEEYDIDSFRKVCSDREQSVHGVAIYCKNGINFSHCTFETFSGVECAILQVKESLLVGIVYCPPKMATISNIRNFLCCFADKVAGNSMGLPSSRTKLVLIGDFNYDFSFGCTFAKPFQDILDLRQFVSCVTTDYGSCLDHIYTNLPSRCVKSLGTLESYFSDHKPIYLTITPDPD